MGRRAERELAIGWREGEEEGGKRGTERRLQGSIMWYKVARVRGDEGGRRGMHPRWLSRHLQRAVNTCAGGNALIGSQMGSSASYLRAQTLTSTSIFSSSSSPSSSALRRFPSSASPSSISETRSRRGWLSRVGCRQCFIWIDVCDCHAIGLKTNRIYLGEESTDWSLFVTS